MPEWKAVARVTEMPPPGNGHVVEVEGRNIAIFEVEGQYYAIGDQCSHDGAGSLADGWLEDTTIECPLHQACFDIRTGRVLSGPATEDVPSFPTKVEDGVIFLEC